MEDGAIEYSPHFTYLLSYLLTYGRVVDPYDAISLKLQQRGHLSVSTPWHCDLWYQRHKNIVTYGPVVPLNVANNTSVQPPPQKKNWEP